MYKMNPNYLLGIEFLDIQHQKLFELMEKVQILLKDQNMLYKYEEIHTILHGLVDYSNIHFKQEVAYMESIDYPRLELHIEAHKGFQDKLSDIIVKYTNISLITQDEIIMDLMEYLTVWLQNHILDCDRKIANFINTGEAI
ncbi:MAG: hemerythrin domain-containing protein [Eubacteriales bacterium]